MNDNIVIISHAAIGIVVFIWMIKQYNWKGRGKILEGEARKTELERHELFGFYIFPATLLVVILAIVGNVVRRGDTKIISSVIPSSLHGATGLIGTGLLLITWNLGRKTKLKRESGEKWSESKRKHGRAADIIIIVGSIHVFLGFLELLKIL